MPANTSQLRPKIKRMMEAFIAEAKKQGINLIVTQGLRTIEEQNKLYAIGRTIKGSKVTNAKGGESNHNYGCAIDVVPVSGGKALWNCDWNKIGRIGKSIGFSWGGDWKSFPDRPHFEYTAGYKLKDFQLKKVDPKKFL